MRKPTSKQRTGLRTASVLGAFLLLAGACGSDDEEPGATAATDASATSATTTVAPMLVPEPVQQLHIDGTEYLFEVSPDPSSGIRPGWTLIEFDNVGVEAHQVMFARLKDGVDLAELAAAGEGDSSGSAAIEFVDMLGGVSYIDPEHGTRALVDLPEGVVLAMCYVPTAEGEAHALLGMSSVLTVGASGASPSTDAPPPPNPRDAAVEGAGGEEVQGTIELAADGYHIPADPSRGWYRVVNTDDADPSKGLHELALLRLDETISPDEAADLVDDLANNIVPSMGIDAVGGMGAISAGFEGYLYLDLTPGQYLAVDFMPDPGEPRPHMLDGYYATFTVAE